MSFTIDQAGYWRSVTTEVKSDRFSGVKSAWEIPYYLFLHLYTYKEWQLNAILLSTSQIIPVPGRGIELGVDVDTWVPNDALSNSPTRPNNKCSAARWLCRLLPTVSSVRHGILLENIFSFVSSFDLICI